MLGRATNGCTENSGQTVTVPVTPETSAAPTASSGLKARALSRPAAVVLTVTSTLRLSRRSTPAGRGETLRRPPGSHRRPRRGATATVSVRVAPGALRPAADLT